MKFKSLCDIGEGHSLLIFPLQKDQNSERVVRLEASFDNWYLIFRFRF